MKAKKQQGAALITALFIMTLVAIIATSMAFRQHLDIRRTQMLITFDQSYQLSQYGILWAKNLLLDNALNNDTETAVDQLPQELATFRYNAISTSAQLDDAQALFNLNNLKDTTIEINNEENEDAEDSEDDSSTEDTSTDKEKTEDDEEENNNDTNNTADDEGNAEQQNSPEATMFINLLQLVDTELNEEDAEQITSNIVNWLSQEKEQQNTNDSFYLAQEPPYRSSGQDFNSITELKLVEGITPELYEKLAPYITALPDATKININTAPTMILRALSSSSDLSEQQADSLKSTIAFDGGFATLDEFIANTSTQNYSLQTELLTTNSDFFLVTVKTRNQDQSLTVYSLLQRVGLSEKGEVAEDEEDDQEETSNTDNDTENNDDSETNDDNKDKDDENSDDDDDDTDDEQDDQQTTNKLAVEIIWERFGHL